MARAYVVQKVKFISQLKDCVIVECNWQARLYSGIKLSGIFVYIYVGTYVCHLYFDPCIFVLAQCSIPSQISLNRIIWFSHH